METSVSSTIEHRRLDPPPTPKRVEVVRVGGAHVIHDCDQAAPAMRAALELLRDFEAPGRRIVVCGELASPASQANETHRELGADVVNLCRADLLVACGEHAGHLVDGAHAAGMPCRRTIACRDLQAALAYLGRTLADGDVVLVKGPPALKLERVISALGRVKEGEPQQTK
jgi:UDP-N-acetylmuramyl pentapeptide synthase